MRVAETFRAAVGYEPDGVWAAPGRVNLIGEHTDYNDGFVLPIALPRRVVVAAAGRTDGLLVVRSVQEPDGPRVAVITDLAPRNPNGWAAYVAGVVWALRESGYDIGGADLVVDSDVPRGAGLSSSAALECATAVALDELFALDLAAAGLALLVIDTRAPHQLVDGEYAARRRACEQAAHAVGVGALRDASPDEMQELHDPTMRRRARHVVAENARVIETVSLLRDRRIREIGPLLTASHESLCHDFEVTVPELDIAVDTALDCGAYGARMTGAGFGGCVIALVDDKAAEPVAASVHDALTRRGFREPAHFLAVPSAGAHRVEAGGNSSSRLATPQHPIPSGRSPLPRC
ncbi:galactokinase [Haloechinothrix halophila]|uniref:galactokinase n=1 Tax=Haloechinothrix halophila TaxID=1069073 RepID=UPI0004199E55|nr:galactokinase family protein [Haloechinothrix halophila]